jgi:O-antigen/teichoic acid export membrane protein
VSAAPIHPASRRERAIRLTVAASAGAKGFSIVCTFIQVPLALHYLGAEAYGFWVTLFSIMLVLNFVDFGLGVGMQHAMARAYGTDNAESMRRAFWTGAAALAVLGVVILAAGVAAAWLGAWPDILHIRDTELRRETPAALSIAVAAFALGLPFNAVARLAAAVQRGWIHAIWIAAGSALSLGFVALAAHAHWGFLGFLAASLLVPTLQGIGLFVHLLRGLGWSLRPTALAPAAELRGMLRSSLYFAFPQFGLALVQSMPAIAISVAAGASAVTGYNLLIRMFSPFQQGQQILLNPIWPAYTEAHSRADHAWVTRTYLRTVGAFFVLALGIAAVAWKSHALLRLWIGPSAVFAGPHLTMLVAAWCLLQMAAQPCVFYLMGIGRLHQLAWVATPGLLVSSFALLLGSRGGTATSVLGYGSLALAVTLLPPLAWETARAMRASNAEACRP